MNGRQCTCGHHCFPDKTSQHFVRTTSKISISTNQNIIIVLMGGAHLTFKNQKIATLPTTGFYMAKLNKIGYKVCFSSSIVGYEHSQNPEFQNPAIEKRVFV